MDKEKFKSGIITKLFVLALICTIVYLPVLSFYFASDDFDRIGPFEFSEVIRCFYTRCSISENAVGWYRPTSILLYFFEYYIWKHNPFGYHLSNLILHILNTILVFFLINTLVKKESIAFLSSMFFAIHPIHTEAVAWICIRHTLLSTLFYLLSFINYILFHESKRTKFYIISLLFFILALCSKEEAITLPLVVLLYNFLYDRKLLLKDKTKLFLPYFVILILYFLFKVFILKTLGGYGFELKFLKYPFPLYIRYFFMNQFKMIYLPYYYPNLLFPWFSIFLLIPLPILLYYFKFKDYAFLVACLFITMLPFVNLKTGVHMGGWYMYLPSVFFCTILSLLISPLLNISKYYKIVGMFLTITISTFYIYATITRLNDWQIASELSKNIPLKIKEFVKDIKPNTKIYAYGIPHNYKGAYIYGNGFENSLKMTFKDNTLKAYPIFLLLFPNEMFEKKDLNTYFFAFIDGDIFRIIFHPDKENYFLFLNKSGKYFEISFEKYYNLTEKVIESYIPNHKNCPAIKLFGINEKILNELIKEINRDKK